MATRAGARVDAAELAPAARISAAKPGATAQASTTAQATAALAVCSTTPAGVVLHTCGIKLDQLPLNGWLTDLAGFSRLSDEGVDMLCVDTTNAEVPGFVTPERNIGPVLDDGKHTAATRISTATPGAATSQHNSSASSCGKPRRQESAQGRKSVYHLVGPASSGKSNSQQTGTHQITPLAAEPRRIALRVVAGSG